MTAAVTTDLPAIRPLRADAQRNRDRIVAAAREAFRESGLDVQMDDIARRADVGVGTLYRHFPTKDALIAELGRQKMNDRIAELDAALAAEDPWEGFVTVLHHAGRAMAQDAGLREVFGPAGTAGCPGEVADCKARQAELLRRLKAAGAIRADVSGNDIQAMLYGLAAAIQSGGKWRLHVEMMIAGLRPTTPAVDRRPVDRALRDTGPMSAGATGPYEDHDHERWVPEPPKRHVRTAFGRDRARIMHSAALRRLAAKTQVHGPGTDDFVRNRLTHTLEVAQIGRELGQTIGCDPDLVDAACLAHDLGHPPFGHNGERALDEFAASCGGFEGNAQTLRILTRLEAKTARPDGTSVGLNLTRAALDAATKYPWPRGDRHPGSKFGVYEDDLPVFAWLRDGAPDDRPCLEAQVMDFADDVAYSVHDVEDGIQAGQIDLGCLGGDAERQSVITLARGTYAPDADEDALVVAYERLRALPYWPSGYDGSRPGFARLKSMTSQLIGRFCRPVEAATHAAYGTSPLTRYAASLVVPEETRHEIAVLKGVAAHFVMFATSRSDGLIAEREVLRGLAERLLSGAPDTLERAFQDDWAHAAER